MDKIKYDDKEGKAEEKPITFDTIYKILIVDDEKSAAEALRTAVMRAPQFKSDVEIVFEGASAMEKITKKEYDLVLSDYKMPGMDGIHLLASVKRTHPNTIRMLITAYSDLKVAKEAINKAEVHSYIEKPWDSEELQNIIHEALNRKSEREHNLIKEIDNVNEAIKRLREFQSNITFSPMGAGFKKSASFEFDSASAFNRFSFEVKKMPNANIDDVHMFENRFVITVSVYPATVTKIK